MKHKIFGGFYGFLRALSYAFVLLPLLLVDQRKIPGYVSGASIAIGAISYPVYLLHNAAPKLYGLAGTNLSGGNLFYRLCSLFYRLCSFSNRCVDNLS